MQRDQLLSRLRQAHAPGGNLVAERAAVLLEMSVLVALLRCPLRLRHMYQDVHRRQQGDAALKVLAELVAALREAELSLPGQRVTPIAAVVFEHKPRELLRAFAGRIQLARTLGRLRALPRAGGQIRRQAETRERT